MNTMRVALDANVLVWAEGLNGDAKKQGALDLVQKLPQDLLRKAGRPPADARTAILSWRDSFAVVETTATVIIAAADLAYNISLIFGTR